VQLRSGSVAEAGNFAADNDEDGIAVPACSQSIG